MAKKKKTKTPDLLSPEDWTALSYVTAACNRDDWHEDGSYPRTIKHGSLMRLLEWGLAERRRPNPEDRWRWRATPQGVEFARERACGTTPSRLTRRTSCKEKVMDGKEAARRFDGVLQYDEADKWSAGLRRTVVVGICRNRLDMTVAHSMAAAGLSSVSDMYARIRSLRPVEDWGVAAEMLVMAVRDNLGGMVSVDVVDAFCDMIADHAFRGDDPDEPSIRSMCIDIRKGWSDKDVQSRHDLAIKQTAVLADLVRPYLLDLLEDEE